MDTYDFKAKHMLWEICRNCIFNIGSLERPICDHVKGPRLHINKCSRKRVKPGWSDIPDEIA